MPLWEPEWKGGKGQIILQFLASDFVVQEQLALEPPGFRPEVDIDDGSDRRIVSWAPTILDENSVISLIKTSETGDL